MTDCKRRNRTPRSILLGLCGFILITAAVSYGFVWQGEIRQQDEYRLMIYNISKAMGDVPACMD